MLGSAVALWAALLWCCGGLALPPPSPPAVDNPCVLGLLAHARHAPFVLEARARSSSSDRRANLSVTFTVRRVLKADKAAGRPLREGEHVRVQVARENKTRSCRVTPRADRTYFLLVDWASAPPQLRLLVPPVLRTKQLAQKLKALLRLRNGARTAKVSGLTSQQVKEGDKVKLVCRVRGRPLPRLAWYKRGVPVPAHYLTADHTKRIWLQTKKRNSTLIITNARLEDSGPYECRTIDEVAKPAFSRGTLTVQPAVPGAPCPMPDPSSYCLNGGTCFFFETVGEAACQCPDGFNGQRCENKDVLQSSMYPNNAHDCKLGLSTSYYC